MKASIFTPEEDKLIVGSEFTLKEIAEKCNKTVSQIKNRKHYLKVHTTAVVVKPEAKPKKIAEVKVDPQPVKTAMTNEEGYVDPTAHKAIAIVMNVNNSVPDVKPGEVYSCDFKQDDYLILQVIGQRALVSWVYSTPKKDDNFYQWPIHIGDNKGFINLSMIFTKKLTDLGTKKGEVDSKTIKFVQTRLRRYMSGPVETAIAEGNKEDLDEASKLFIDSVSYFNEKNGTEVKVPEKNLSLKDAIDISDSMGIELKEFLRDHSNDRKLDRLVQLEEEAKKIREELGL